MDAQRIKEYIYENELIEEVLINLNCHHIKHKSGFWTAGNPDGDNISAIVVYENENLTTLDYTRTLIKQSRTTDIFDLIAYFEELNFPETLRWCCNLFGLDIYEEPEDRPESLQILDMLRSMQTGEEQEDNTPLRPIPEEILNYYLPYGNIMFEDDGISLLTQREWEIKYDPQSNSILIPLRDELGSLIAIKARRFKYTQDTPPEKRRFNCILEEGESKYFFLEPGAKSQILFGLYKNFDAIKQQNVVYVGESEKFCMQLYDMGYYGVSCGGSKLSKRQIEMLTRLGVKIVLCFDKDIDEKKLKGIANDFLDGVPIYAVLDKENILNEKESPSDNINKWTYLIKNNIYRIR